jgi:hypothetical protein
MNHGQAGGRFDAALEAIGHAGAVRGCGAGGELALQKLFLVRTVVLQHPCAGAVGKGLPPHQLGDLGTGISESLQALQRALDLGDMIAAVADSAMGLLRIQPFWLVLGVANLPG